MNKKIIFAAALGLLSLSACGDGGARGEQADRGAKVQQEAMGGKATNAEIDNIGNRLRLTSDPNLLGHIALINKVGQVVLYTTIKGKVTSGSKRLTSTTYCPGIMGTDCPSDEGTYGSSNPYIFFWTANGQYIQTSMDYIYSDKPLRLDEKPLFTIADSVPHGGPMPTPAPAPAPTSTPVATPPAK